jgi:1-acyl-sn-glycerol-3-phosphate acyltransferase
MTRFFQNFIKVTVTLVLLALLFLVNLVQMLSLLVLPFSVSKFREVNGMCAKFWWHSLVFTMLHLQKVKVIFVGDEIPKNDNAFVISNHTGLTDVLFILCLADQNNRLQDLKWFVKDILKFVPLVGWGLWFLNSIFLKRNWTKDRSSIESTFHAVKTHRIPIWLVTFLEGTRLTPVKLKKSQEYAKSLGIQPLQNVLIPRTKGFVASMQGLEGHLTAVYDITLGYTGAVPSLWDVTLGNVSPVHVKLKRYDFESLPKGEEELSKWALNLFEKKDEELTFFKKNGFFR